jgi:hypothetical protein
VGTPKQWEKEKEIKVSQQLKKTKKWKKKQKN